MILLGLIFTGCNKNEVPVNPTIQENEQEDIGYEGENDKQPDFLKPQLDSILNPPLNNKCGNEVLHLKEMGLDFVKENIKYGSSPEDILEFWGHPCGTMENPQTPMFLWRYDYPAQEGYVFVPASELYDVDEEGLLKGKMMFQLQLGWHANKLAYYGIEYVNDDEIIHYFDAPDELKCIVIECVE